MYLETIVIHKYSRIFVKKDTHTTCPVSLYNIVKSGPYSPPIFSLIKYLGDGCKSVCRGNV